ncbi:restriction endonuclease, partial [Bacillus sp. S34]|nr:restriction endonuclease [Bacillus sp. S34]
GVDYNPDPATIPADMPPRGTRIVLKDLNSKRASVTRAALRRRLARRFDVLKFSSDAADRFVIKIDGEPIGYDDRGDLKRLQYIWQLGADEIPEENTPRVKRRWLIPEQDTVVDEGRGWKLEGWFGTVNQPSELIDDEDKQESLRHIIILAR